MYLYSKPKYLIESSKLPRAILFSESVHITEPVHLIHIKIALISLADIPFAVLKTYYAMADQCSKKFIIMHQTKCDFKQYFYCYRNSYIHGEL